MGEEQRIITALLTQGLDRLAGRLPGQAKLGDVPFSELEAVGAGLGYEQMDQFKSSHKALCEIIAPRLRIPGNGSIILVSPWAVRGPRGKRDDLLYLMRCRPILNACFDEP